ncbi:CU044_5270 family protein [Nocardiopsis sp. FIRDI 009]|uniref:CU044_5270 family protein n=1 Tax=Nocardiopsis sp. FIRDI 009 TaxID=714197 RepID=UPI001E62E120|nr:CU044_5270 family protein [Nocardiopsis sp. FIRDI 009]
MDHLRRMREDVPEPTSDSLNARLAWRPGHPNAAASAARRFGSGPVPGRLPLAVSGAAVLVAGAAFAVLVLGPLGFTRPDPVTLTPASPTEGSADDGATEVMAPLAEAVRSQPVDGAVWYQHHVSADAWGVGPEGDRYGVYSITEVQSWVDTETGQATHELMSADWSLVAERGREAWKRDGSPTRWPREEERWEIPRGDEEEEGPFTPGTVSYFFGDTRMSAQDLQGLPSDPERLREMLRPESEERLNEEDAAEAGFVVVPDPSVETVRVNLGRPLPPEVRAGVYEILAELPGVRAAEGVAEDVSGRPAVGVAYDVEGLLDGRYEERLLFDPGTGLLLSSERVVVEVPEWAADWAEPGDVVAYTLYETTEWNDAWPDVSGPEVTEGHH